MSINPNVNNYNQDELKSIYNKLLEVHYRYPLGICVKQEIHKLFHKNYGNRFNTPQQFIEFVQRLESHEFDDYLKGNNLNLNINYQIINQIKDWIRLSEKDSSF